MFTTGKIIFALTFFIVFLIAMIWSYKKDAPLNKIHFGGTSKVLLIIIFLFTAIFIFVKLRH